MTTPSTLAIIKKARSGLSLRPIDEVKAALRAKLEEISKSPESVPGFVSKFGSKALSDLESFASEDDLIICAAAWINVSQGIENPRERAFVTHLGALIMSTGLSSVDSTNRK